jgi:hypothetical protein
MKQWVLCACASILLASCSSFPKPGHKYLIQSWQAKLDEGSHIYTLGASKFGLTFSAVPEKVMYLKNILYTYHRPKRGDEIAYTTSWNFDVSVSATSEPEGVREFIKAKQIRDGGWLDYEIEEIDLQRPQ